MIIETLIWISFGALSVAVSGAIASICKLVAGGAW